MIEMRLTPESKELIKDHNKKKYSTWIVVDEEDEIPVDLFAYSKDNFTTDYFEVIEAFLKESEEDELIVFTSLSPSLKVDDIINSWNLEEYMDLKLDIDDLFL